MIGYAKITVNIMSDIKAIIRYFLTSSSSDAKGSDVKQIYCITFTCYYCPIFVDGDDFIRNHNGLSYECDEGDS